MSLFLVLKGVVVTVSGSGFINASLLLCSFGEVKATATFYSEVTVGCSLPESTSPSSVIINLQYVNGFRSFSAVKFVFLPLPVLTSVSPSCGSHFGSRITVFGDNFDSRASFYVGESVCQRLIKLSASPCSLRWVET